MKQTLILIGVIIFLAIFSWIQWTKEPEVIEVPVEIVKYDSIFTVRVDTIKPDMIVKTVIKEVPTYIYLEDTLIKNYEDSLITPEFKVFIYDDIKGTLTNRWFEYVNLTPIRIESEKEIETIKYIDVIKPAPNVGNLLGATMSYNYKDTSANFGLQYIRYKDNKGWSVGYELGGTVRGGLMFRF